MTGRAVVLLVLVSALLVAPAASAASDVSVTVDRHLISTKLGKRFVFRSTITNRGPEAAAGLIAHLNVLSLRSGTYVDPEDWSSNRTRYLATIPPGGSVETTWRMQAVNDGEFGVYVAALPSTGVARPPVTSPTVHVMVAERKTLNSGGILPLALGIPAGLGALAAGLRFGRGRR